MLPKKNPRTSGGSSGGSSMTGIHSQLGVAQTVIDAVPSVMGSFPQDTLKDKYKIGDPIVSSLPDASEYLITELRKIFEKDQHWDMAFPENIRTKFNENGIRRTISLYECWSLRLCNGFRVQHSSIDSRSVS